MHVTGPGAVGGAFPVQPLRPASQTPAGSGVTPVNTEDSVEISSAGKLMDQLGQSQVRHDRLERIRAEIAAGTYETPEKLEAALERMLVDVQRDGED